MSDVQGQNQSKVKEGGSSRLIIIIGAVIIFLLVAVIVILLLRKTPEPEQAVSNDESRKVAGSSRLVLDKESASNIMDEMRQEVEEGMFECNMSMTWTFADGTSESKDAIVVNSNNNSYPFYFDVTLDGTNELIYSSPVVPVGSQLTNFKLDKDLDPGEYSATVMYSLLQDEESQVVKSQAGFVIKIIVEN